MGIKICQTCGKEHNTPYPLCPECFKLRDAGFVVKCDNCGLWHLKWGSCNDAGNVQKKANEPDPRKFMTCLICKQYSYGKHFCDDCAEKYQNHSFDIRLTDMEFDKIIDKHGNLDFECSNGHKVRSRAEALIANFFFENRIRYVYEKPIYYMDENGEKKTLSPDFYLPDFKTYIEYNEIKSLEYIKRKIYTYKIYRDLGLKIKIVNESGLKSLTKTFKSFLTIKK